MKWRMPMRLFFYAACPAEATDKYYRKVTAMHNIPECIELTAGSQFNTPAAFQLSSGDVLLLFACDGADMQHLQQLADDLEDFQVILLLENATPVILELGYSLRPRFVCQGARDIPVLQQLLTKMFTPPARPGCRQGSSRPRDLPTKRNQIQHPESKSR